MELFAANEGEFARVVEHDVALPLDDHSDLFMSTCRVLGQAVQGDSAVRTGADRLVVGSLGACRSHSGQVGGVLSWRPCRLVHHTLRGRLLQ